MGISLPFISATLLLLSQLLTDLIATQQTTTVWQWLQASSAK